MGLIGRAKRMFGMSATYRDGQVIFDAPVDWPDGARIVVRLATEAQSNLSDDEFEGLLRELCDEFAAYAKSNSPLSNFAVSRQGLYEGHL